MRLDRASLLHETAVGVGQRWFQERCENLGREHRRIEGGWPGTVTEARALVGVALTSALGGAVMALATSGELSRAARTTYAEARRAWLASRDPREQSGDEQPALEE